MDRLIKADDVKDLLLGLDSLPWEEQVNELVDRIPTAYDVEAVVRELKEANFVVYERTSKGLAGLRSVRLIDAIAIVKRGGRNDAL